MSDHVRIESCDKEEHYHTLLTDMIELLRLPGNALKENEVFEYKKIEIPRDPSPQELIRIGRGYRDKGNLSLEAKLPSLLEAEAEMLPDISFESLRTQWESFLRNNYTKAGAN